MSHNFLALDESQSLVIETAPHITRASLNYSLTSKISFVFPKALQILQILYGAANVKLINIEKKKGG